MARVLAAVASVFAVLMELAAAQPSSSSTGGGGPLSSSSSTGVQIADTPIWQTVVIVVGICFVCFVGCKPMHPLPPSARFCVGCVT
jgi:hypothetical protein